MENIQTDLNHKYKDRDPLKTVDIITKFFESEGYKIEIEYNVQSEGNTFWCHLNLKRIDDPYGKTVLGTNGKGATLEYSLASGHAEMYERYCARFHTRSMVDYDQYSNNYKKFGYYIDPEEKMLSYDEIKASSSVLSNFLDIFSAEKTNNFLKIQQHFYPEADEKIPCIPYFNLNDGHLIYLNPRIVDKAVGSDGLAAGNTLEEAIVQAMSEVYEHYVTDRVYYNNNEDTIYYQLDLHGMQDSLPEYINNIINSIEKAGHSIYVFDMSYIYNMPVLMSVLVSDNHLWYINLGAAPVFEIALERVFTEIYQGTPSFKENLKIPSKLFMQPYRNYTVEDAVYDNYSSPVLRKCYPEEILLNRQLVSTYNHNVFLSGNSYSNEYLCNYFRKLNKINNFDVYVRDLSQISDIRAVRVFCANQDVFPWKYTICNYMPLEDRIKISDFVLNVFGKNKYDKDYIEALESIENILMHPVNQNALDEYMALLLDGGDIIYPISTLDEFFAYYINLIRNDDDTTKILPSRVFYFKTLYDYVKSKKYTKEEVIKIFVENLGYKNIAEINDDYDNIFDKSYVIKNMFYR